MTAAVTVCGIASFGSSQTATPPDASVKAAFLYNFAKFTEWPALPSNAPIRGCVVGSDEIAAALVEIASNQDISGHTLEVWRPENTTLGDCHLLFIEDGASRRFTAGLDGIRALPVLTISDSKGFSRARGIIELYVEDGRMRFAVNLDAVERSGLRLSSRLLELATIVRDDHGQ